MGLRGPKPDITVLEETKKMYDACNKNMAEVGRKLNISRERVRQRMVLWAAQHKDCTSIRTVIVEQ